MKKKHSSNREGEREKGQVAQVYLFKLLKQTRAHTQARRLSIEQMWKDQDINYSSKSALISIKNSCRIEI